MKLIYALYNASKKSVLGSAASSYYLWNIFLNKTYFGKFLAYQFITSINFSWWVLSTAACLLTLFGVIATLEGIEFFFSFTNFASIFEFSKWVKENFLRSFVFVLTFFSVYLNNSVFGRVLTNQLLTLLRFWIGQVLIGAAPWFLPAVAATSGPLLMLLAWELFQWYLAFKLEIPIAEVSELVDKTYSSDLNELNPNFDDQPETVENSKSAVDNSNKKKGWTYGGLLLCITAIFVLCPVFPGR